MITCRIDVDKIDKTKIFKGEKGRWYDFVLIETPNGRYSDYMITESITKEEREMGVKATVLGNGKTLGKPVAKVDTKKEETQTESETDLPF